MQVVGKLIYIMYAILVSGVQIGSVWPEEKFQDIVAYIKKASDRLDDMIRESWSGEETIEI